MPAEAVATPPAAPAAPAAPAPTPASVGSVMPQSKGEINVTAATLEPVAPPKPGSAQDGLFKKLNKLAGQDDKPAEAKPAEAKPGEKPTEKPAAPGTEKPADGEASSPESKAGEKGKVNPWKLYEESKKKLAQYEKDLAETKKLVINEAERKAEMEKYSAIEKRAKELEDHIRFVDYSKSQEFQEKYQKPYKEAWDNAMKELEGIEVMDASSGVSRAMTASDILELVNMPATKARELARELFGDHADDVMAQRKEIRAQFDAQSKALEDARKNGAEREKAARAEHERKTSEITKHITEKWAQLNESIVKDERNSKYFNHIEGDEEANTRLSKGYELVDTAFATNPMDPSLTPEQRDDIVMKHVAVRNRAAAYGRLTYLLDKAQAENAAMAEELKQYRESTPNLGGQRPAGAAPSGPSGMDGLMARIAARAK